VLLGDGFSLPPPVEHPAGAPVEGPDRIGIYEIIDEIGRGGMATVYAARQAGLDRIVALKCLPEGRGGVAGLELRFLREAQTAARLRHPHIVSVHDCGRANGQVFFTMDYIEGGDLAHRLREHAFSPREAATLLHKVAGALAYTHGEGVLHRDLKPSNILLEGDEPRLADFGLAAQLDPGGDLTAITGVLGTPHYVAPEALHQGSAALTAASDVYALGVVLYEMLTGRTPYAGASPAELPGLIDRRDPPLPRLLAPAVPRNLQTICLRCLEREPTRRYPSAAALEEDLRRFLAGEEILARAPGAMAALVKYARRHRLLFASAAAIAVVLMAATTVSTTLAVRATQAEKAAAAEARANKALAEFLQNDLLAQASPGTQPDRDLKLRTALDRAAGRLDQRFPDEPLLEADLRETLATTYDSLGEFAGEEKQLRRVIDLRRAKLGPEHARTLAASSLLASCLASQGRLDEAHRWGSATYLALERTLGPDAPATLQAANNQVYVLKALGLLPEATRLARRTLASARRTLGEDRDETRYALSNLSSILWAQGQMVEAEALNVEALAAFTRARGPEHPETLSVMSNLASVYWSEGKLAEAEQMNRRILDIRLRLLGPDHPETLRSRNNLATVFTNEGKYVDALELHRQNLEIRQRTRGPENADTLSSQHNLAQVLAYAGRLPEALDLCQQTRATAVRALGPEHYITLLITDTLAGFCIESGRVEEGEALASDNFAAYRRVNGDDNIKTVAAGETLANGLLRAGRYPEAEALLRDLVVRRQKLTPKAWRTQVTRSQLGEAIAAQQRYAEAEPLLRESFAALEAMAATIPPSQRHFLPQASQRVLQLYLGWGHAAEAEAWRHRPPPAAQP
jgi:hypothetical protein